MARTTKRTKRVDDQKGHHVTNLHAFLGATQISARLAPVQNSFDSSTRLIDVAPPRGYKPPPTFRDCINLHHCLQRRHFPIPRYAKRPDVALYAMDPLFLLPTPSSPHCTLKVSEDGSHWQPPDAYSDNPSRPQKSSPSRRRLNALILDYLKGTVVRDHPMMWSLALCPDDAKQDPPVVYGLESGVMFLAKSPHTASIQEDLDCIGLYHSGLE